MTAAKRKKAEKVSLVGCAPGTLLPRRDGHLAMFVYRITCLGDPDVYQLRILGTVDTKSVWSNGRRVGVSGFSEDDIIEIVKPDEDGNVSDRAEMAVLTWVCQCAGVQNMLKNPDVYETMINQHRSAVQKMIADHAPRAEEKE